MTTYYISGPMRGLPDYNYPAFLEVERQLAAELVSCDGVVEPFEILNPARNFDGDTTREVQEYMNLDLQMILRAEVIVLLPGWRESSGARREVQLAIWSGKRFVKAFLFEENYWVFEPIETPTLEDTESPRASALDEAKQLITGDRNNSYGPPTEDFRRTADMATAFGFRVVTHRGAEPEPLQPHHVAVFMMMLKTSRLAWSPRKRDSWVDAAGYAGCGYECAETEAAA